jgi:hypothetical protein
MGVLQDRTSMDRILGVFTHENKMRGSRPSRPDAKPLTLPATTSDRDLKNAFGKCDNFL